MFTRTATLSSDSPLKMKDSDGTVTPSKDSNSEINDFGVSDFNARNSLNVSGEKQHLLSSRNQTPDLGIVTSDQAKAQAPEQNIRQDEV